MANNLASNVTEKLLRKFVPGFENDQVLTKSIDTSLIADEYDAESGDTVSIKRPGQFKAIRTADGDLTAQTEDNIIAGKATATVQNMITVWVKWSQIEAALKLNQLDELVINPMKDTIVTELEMSLAAYMKLNAQGRLGNIGTAIDAWGDIAQAGTYFKDVGYKGQVYAPIDPWSVQNLAELQKGLAGNDQLIRSAWEQAQLPGYFASVRPFMSDSLSNQTIGTATGAGITVTSITGTTAAGGVGYLNFKDTYKATVVLAGAGNAKTITAGTQLEFPATYLLNMQNKQRLVKNGAAIPFVGTVLTDATSDAGGAVTVTISGAPIYDATNSQYNTVHRAITAGDTVTILGTASATFKPSLAYAKSAFGMATIKLPKLDGWESNVATYKGLSFRATKSSDPTTGKMALRMDLLPAFATFNPHLAAQLNGN